MAEFILKIITSNVMTRLTSTAIGTSFSPVYFCTFMDEVESKFLETEPLRPLTL